MVKELRFGGKYIIKSRLEVKTGLHIGTAGNSLDIGGVDNAVIKGAKGRPFIPGSSLKGKMRSLMEFAENKIQPYSLVYSVYNKDKIERCIRLHICGDEDCTVCNLFGRNHGEHKIVDDNGEFLTGNFSKIVTPTRLIVRDAELDEDSINEEMKSNMDFDWTEVKFENNLDRITSSANPRQTERVPAGAEFLCEMVVNVYNDEGDKYLKKVLKAMSLLEDDYLGGQGSRGYGKIVFKDITILYKDSSCYEGIREEVKLSENSPAISDVLKNII